MDNAIVTITCPHCGGQVKGVQQMEHEQTVPCTYCGTELHVPHIGEEIVREVVVQTPAPAPDPTPNPLLDPVYDESLRPTPNRAAQVVVGLVLLLGALIAIFAMRCDADNTMEQMKRDDQARDACMASCKKQCEHPPNAHEVTSTGDDSLDQDLARTMQDADRMTCEMDCEQSHDCRQLRASPPR